MQLKKIVAGATFGVMLAAGGGGSLRCSCRA